MSESDLLEQLSGAVKEHSLTMALRAARETHNCCAGAEVPDAVFDAAGELVELLEAWARETGAR